MKEAIILKQLSKSYENKLVVNKVDLTIGEGELFGLLGVNGAGKTTIIKMLSGLVKPTSGEAVLLGKSITTDLEEVKGLIGVSPQETAIAPNLTVKENLELMAGINGFSKIEVEEKVNRLIAEFSLQPFANTKSKKLSGGWQRKLSIAMALITEPRILFLDEPTLGLDILSRRELWNLIRELKSKTTIILTTHYLEEAEELSDRICIMKDGFVITVGSANEIKQKTNTTKFEDAFVKVVEGVY